MNASRKEGSCGVDFECGINSRRHSDHSEAIRSAPTLESVHRQTGNSTFVFLARFPPRAFSCVSRIDSQRCPSCLMTRSSPSSGDLDLAESRRIDGRNSGRLQFPERWKSETIIVNGVSVVSNYVVRVIATHMRIRIRNDASFAKCNK